MKILIKSRDGIVRTGETLSLAVLSYVDVQWNDGKPRYQFPGTAEPQNSPQTYLSGEWTESEGLRDFAVSYLWKAMQGWGWSMYRLVD